MQEVQVRSLVRELRSHIPQSNQAHTPLLEKLVHCNEDPVQPKLKNKTKPKGVLDFLSVANRLWLHIASALSSGKDTCCSFRKYSFPILSLRCLSGVNDPFSLSSYVN